MTQNVQKSAARLGAVQALYQASQNKVSAQDLVREYLDHRVSMEVEGEEIVQMDGALFTKIIEGVYARSHDLEAVIRDHYNKEQEIEPLLKAILLCAGFEIMVHVEVDMPIIINDYLDVAHSYYGKGEVSLVNGLLDSLKSLREGL